MTAAANGRTALTATHPRPLAPPISSRIGTTSLHTRCLQRRCYRVSHCGVHLALLPSCSCRLGLIHTTMATGVVSPAFAWEVIAAPYLGRTPRKTAGAAAQNPAGDNLEPALQPRPEQFREEADDRHPGTDQSASA
jgi:hypothetical protein